jgi:hypothetical protein
MLGKSAGVLALKRAGLPGWVACRAETRHTRPLGRSPAGANARD